MYCSTDLLRTKSNLRLQRVIVDLIYVLVVVITLDVINIISVFVDRIELNHPIQTFSYTLTLWMEFLVLNQLMAVAAQGLHRDTFGERRYHTREAAHDFSNCRQDLQVLDVSKTDIAERSSEKKNLGTITPTAPPSTTEKSSDAQRYVSMPSPSTQDEKGWL
ncbi:MAG: hypothetical protein Q9209_004319 [Squamulea sp. 1 TL-2023]